MRASPTSNRRAMVVAALAGLLVVPVIEGTFTIVEQFRARPQMSRGVVRTSAPSLVALAQWLVAWLSGGLAAGLLTFALLLGLLRLAAVGAGPRATPSLRWSAAGAAWWLALATHAFALYAVSRSARDPTGLRAAAALVGLGVACGAGLNGWLALRSVSRTRGVVGALVLGLLVLPVAAVGIQPAWQMLLLWQRFARSAIHG